MSAVLTPLPAWVDVDALAAVDINDEAWRLHRPCTEQPAVFFPEMPSRGGNYDYSDAETVCAGCPSRLPCLAWWLATSDHNTDQSSGCYVGGTTPRERITVRRALAARRAA